MKKKRKLNNKGKFSIGVVFLVIVAVLIWGVNSANNNIKNTTTATSNTKVEKGEEPTSKPVETYNASLIACGDIMAHKPQLDAQYNPETKTYSFENNFKYVKKYISSADFAMANLETTMCKDDVYSYSSYPTFNTPDALSDALKDAGFDLLSTINNHSFDMSKLGVERTLKTLSEKDIDTVGTRAKVSDDDYIIEKVNNINLGITAYSYGEIKNGSKYLNGIKVTDDKTDLMNIFDTKDVDEAFDIIYSTVDKFKDTDMQIVIIHWGDEYSRAPNSFQKELAQKLCDAGVDIIIGSHPHVVQPVEMITSSDKKHETLVIYSLGNYISNQRRNVLSMYTEDGLMVDINITKKSNEKEAKVEKVTCIPTWVNKYQSNKKCKNVYEILPIADNILDEANNIPDKKLRQSYKNTASQVKTDDKISVIESPFN